MFWLCVWRSFCTKIQTSASVVITYLVEHVICYKIGYGKFVFIFKQTTRLFVQKQTQVHKICLVRHKFLCLTKYALRRYDVSQDIHVCFYLQISTKNSILTCGVFACLDNMQFWKVLYSAFTKYRPTFCQRPCF